LFPALVWFHRLRPVTTKIKQSSSSFSQSSMRARVVVGVEPRSTFVRSRIALIKRLEHTTRRNLARATRRRTSTPSVIHAKNKITTTRFARRGRIPRVAS
jgi:hypothetical protein